MDKTHGIIPAKRSPLLVLRYAFLEGVRSDEDMGHTRHGTLPPKLLGCTGHVGDDGLFQLLQGMDLGPEGTGADDLLLGRGDIFESET